MLDILIHGGYVITMEGAGNGGKPPGGGGGKGDGNWGLGKGEGGVSGTSFLRVMNK